MKRLKDTQPKPKLPKTITITGTLTPDEREMRKTAMYTTLLAVQGLLAEMMVKMRLIGQSLDWQAGALNEDLPANDNPKMVASAQLSTAHLTQIKELINKAGGNHDAMQAFMDDLLSDCPARELKVTGYDGDKIDFSIFGMAIHDYPLSNFSEDVKDQIIKQLK